MAKSESAQAVPKPKKSKSAKHSKSKTKPDPSVEKAQIEPAVDEKVQVAPNPVTEAQPAPLPLESSDETLLMKSTADDPEVVVHHSAMAPDGSINGTAVNQEDDESMSFAEAVAAPPPLESSMPRYIRPEINGDGAHVLRPYPQLKHRDSHQGHETEAWRAGGIRFAPLRIPFNRRLQTAAVFFHCMSIVTFVSLFWFTCANPLTWPILVPYLIHLSFSTAAIDGKLSYRSERLRSLPLWKLFASYFPMRLHKTHDLPPNRKYIMGYHPHGIISHGAWAAFATNALGFADKFPGITNSLLTLESNFRLPFYRDWILAMGIRSVSKESIRNTLSHGGPNNDGQGRAVTIVVGGARESLESQPGSMRLILKGRKGFVKMALRTGADLVPVIGFGETDLYDQLSPKTHPMVHKIQMFVLKVFKFTIPALHGRGLLNYDVGLLPYRRPVNIVVGKPIEVDQSYGDQPAQEDVDRYHEMYVEEVERLFEAYKDQFANGKTPKLQIVS
ncbi:hypothetical protein HIM_01222 [Hirsutella minnesotensis 3608]|nr:hypothetical protein HIM_01222 [Hirsutella minnesotensis 3608]